MLEYISLAINLHELPWDLIQSFISKNPIQSYKRLKISMYHGSSFSASQNFPLESYHFKHVEIKSEHSQQLRLLKTKYGIQHPFILKGSTSIRVIYTHQVNLTLFIFLSFSRCKKSLSVFNRIEKEKTINAPVLFSAFYSWYLPTMEDALLCLLGVNHAHCLMQLVNNLKTHWLYIPNFKSEGTISEFTSAAFLDLSESSDYWIPCCPSSENTPRWIHYSFRNNNKFRYQ